MRYLITTKYDEPFFTEWFDPENNFNAEVGMIVYDLTHYTYTVDGINWKEITFDHL